MNRALLESADEIRDIARREARRAVPPLERFQVRRADPLRLEAIRSGTLLDEDDDDLFIGRNLKRRVKVGDFAYVARERDGDYVVIAISPKAARGSDDAGGAWFFGEGVPADGLGDAGDFYLRTSNDDVYLKVGGEWEVVGNLGGVGGGGSTWHVGEGVPAEGLGADGDLYLNSVNGDVFEKVGGAWELVANIKGPKGDAGEKGATGEKGEKGDKGEKGEKGDQGEQGEPGEDGDDGEDGRDAGLAYKFSTSNVYADPGVGYLRFNNPTEPQFVSAFWLNETDADGGNLAAFIAALDDSTSTSKGLILFRSQSDPSKFWLGRVEGDENPTVVWDEGAWWFVNVTYISHSGTFSADEPISFSFSPTGDIGDDGEDGRDAGLRYRWLTATTNSDPGAGNLKMNLFGTVVRISETDLDGNGIAALLATWDDSTNAVKGTITIRQVSDPKRFRTFNVIGTLEDPGAYNNFATTAVATGEALENEAEVVVEFSRAGDAGAAGEKGGTGEAGISPSDWKDAVRVATTANVTIATALNNGDTIDGVVLATGDRVLVHKQTTKSENGIWVVGAVPARATDADAAGELSGGTRVYVESGTIYSKRTMTITTAGSITPGTTAHEWEASIKDHGQVEALPTSAALVNDLCTYKADKTNGVFWRLTYDGEGEYPWKKIGGPPLIASSNVQRALNNAAYTSLPTDPLSINTPLKGDYDITIQGSINTTAASRVGWLSYAVGATVASDNWGITVLTVSQATITSPALLTRHTGLAAAAKIEEKAKTSGGECTFIRRRLIVNPVRVG